jgi:hypothetical protein
VKLAVAAPLAPEEEQSAQIIQEDERAQLLALTEQLAQPELSQHERMSLVDIMRMLLSRAPGGAVPSELKPSFVEVSAPALPL